MTKKLDQMKRIRDEIFYLTSLDENGGTKVQLEKLYEKLDLLSATISKSEIEKFELKYEEKCIHITKGGRPCPLKSYAEGKYPTYCKNHQNVAFRREHNIFPFQSSKEEESEEEKAFLRAEERNEERMRRSWEADQLEE